MLTTPVLYLLIVNSLLIYGKDVNEVLRERNRLIESEMELMLGSDLVLSDSEQKANEIVMELKLQELDSAFKYQKKFNLSKHFFHYKDEIEDTLLFKLIKEMPKGAVLHFHDTALMGPDYVLELTYLSDLFVCFGSGKPQFHFSKTTPKKTCETQWQTMKDARYSSGNVEKFDSELKKHFSVVIDNPDEVYTDVNAAWNVFQEYFITTQPIFTYKPVWEKYFYDALKTFREDNVMYVEVRSVLPYLYDLEGNIYDSVATAETYKKVLDEFLRDYPDFFGAKLIYAPLRRVDPDTVKGYLSTALKIKTSVPSFFAGFDLVGQEDLGIPTKEFLHELVDSSNELDYFFHAGETNWYGSSSDENLFDAIVLGSKRIGHAFALIKHPVLLEEVKKRKIAIEVNVISNAVLRLVDDVRNHPLASLLAGDYPVVVSSDDPGIWEAEPLSHDFYVAFVGVASRHADLRLLKKLALNSLYFSTYPNKDKMVHEFNIRWTKFIDNVVKDKW